MKSQDVCDLLTQSVIAALEDGVMPWSQPWESQTKLAVPRRHNNMRYRGINILILWARARYAGFRSAYWMTFKQALEYGGCVRKGETGTQIVFANRVTRTEASASGEDVERSFSFLQAYTVFNADQILGLPEQFAAPIAVEKAGPHDWSDYAEALAWFDAIPAEVQHGGDRAVYFPSSDRIALPKPDAFCSPLAYLSTRAHETIHWTKAESRLARSFDSAKWGDGGYAMEELVAELGAAFTMAELGQQPEIRDDHAPYIADWLTALKNDRRVLLTAAAKASDALEYLCTFQADAQAETPQEFRAAA